MTKLNRPTPEQLAAAREAVAVGDTVIPKDDVKRYGKSVRMAPPAIADRKIQVDEKEPALPHFSAWEIAWLGGRVEDMNSKSLVLKDTIGAESSKRTRVPLEWFGDPIELEEYSFELFPYVLVVIENGALAPLPLRTRAALDLVGKPDLIDGESVWKDKDWSEGLDTLGV